MSQWCVESYPSSLYKFEIFSKLMFLAFCHHFWPWSGGSKSMPTVRLISCRLSNCRLSVVVSHCHQDKEKILCRTRSYLHSRLGVRVNEDECKCKATDKNLHSETNSMHYAYHHYCTPSGRLADARVDKDSAWKLHTPAETLARHNEIITMHNGLVDCKRQKMQGRATR